MEHTWVLSIFSVVLSTVALAIARRRSERVKWLAGEFRALEERRKEAERQIAELVIPHGRE